MKISKLTASLAAALLLMQPAAASAEALAGDINGDSTADAADARILLSFLPEILRFADDYRSLVYGLLLVLMVRFMPEGLFGNGSPIMRALGRLFKPAAAASGKGGAA